MSSGVGAAPSAAPALPPDLDPRQPPRRNWVLRGLAGGVSAAIVAASVFGYLTLNYYDDKITRIDNVFAGREADRPVKIATESLNILLVGSDSREGLTREEIAELKVGIEGGPDGSGRRADTAILMHLDSDWSRATLVSFPRDSLVEIPEFTNSEGKTTRAQQNKLNAAYAIGGPQLLVSTIEQNTDLRIDHYVEVGFDGFVKAVDAVGGVDVCTEEAISDRRSGLELAAGESRLDGAQALAFARARYFDPTADIGRMGRQQQLLASLFNEATSTGVLLNPIRLNSLLDATLSSISTDPGFDRQLMLNLATKMRDVAGGEVVFTTVPIGDANNRIDGIGSTVEWDEQAAEELFRAIREDQPIGSQSEEAAAEAPSTTPVVSVPPGSISMKVLNGVGTAGLARQSADQLAALGFSVTGVGDGESVTATEIRYDPRWDESVKTVAAALPGARLVPVPGQGGTFVVVIGDANQKFQSVTVQAAADEPAPSASESAAPVRSAADPLCG